MTSSITTRDLISLVPSIQTELITETIHYYRPIDMDGAKWLSEKLEILRKFNLPIKLKLFTKGGDRNSALSIYNDIEPIRNTTIIATGLVASCGLVVLQSAKRRLAMSNTRFLLHPGRSSSGELSSDEDHLSRGQEALELRKICCEIVGKRMNPKLNEKQFLQKFSNDTYISAKDALNLGLIDEIV